MSRTHGVKDEFSIFKYKFTYGEVVKPMCLLEKTNDIE